jgi:hypothetical protein
MIESEFRPITSAEREVFRKLLSLNFPSRDELLTQLESLLARTIDDDGSLSLKVTAGVVAPQNCRIPIEARCPDTNTQDDSEPHVKILLHVVEGKMFELEIYKDDGSPVIDRPNPEKFQLFLPLIRF